MDSYNDKIGIAGVSYDSDLTSAGASGGPFIAQIEPGNIYSWSKVFDLSGNIFINVKYSTNNGKYLVAMNNMAPLYLVGIKTADGSIYFQ